MKYPVFLCGPRGLEDLEPQGTQGISTLVLAWIGKRLKAPAGKDFLELVQE
jgi:hypothetical protein